VKQLLLIATLFFPEFTPAQVRTGVVTGQLLSRNGQTVAGVRMSAMAVPEPNASPSGTTALMSVVPADATGRYRLENIPPGQYYIIAGFVDLPTYYPGVSSLSGATAVTVSAGATVSGIDFPMVVPAGVTVKGRVIRPANQSLAGIQRVALRGGAATQEGPLAADGSFEFSRVRPGTYNLFVGSGTLAQPINITVADKDVTDIEAVVVSTVIVSGTLLIEGDGVRPRLSLSFTPFKGGVTAPGASILPNGTLRATLPEGDYRVGWTSLPAGYELKSITAGSVDLIANPLKVTAAQSVPPLLVTLAVASPAPWGKVSGRVVGLSAARIGVSNRLILTGSTMIDTLDVPINPDGSFEFARVLPGSYTARLTPPLPVPLAPIVVPSNKGVTGVEIQLPSLKEVAGQVVIEGGSRSAPQLSFIVSNSPGTSTGSAAVAATNQGNGAFTVTLPEGERRVTVSAPGYVVRSVTYGSTDLLKDSLKIAASDSDQIRVTLAASSVNPVLGGVPGGIVGGVIGGILAPPAQFINSVVPPPPPPRPPLLISSVPPVYPPLAQSARVQGVVVLAVTISRDGVVDNVAVVSGHPLLNDAAIAAVRQWRYQPQVLNGQAMAVQTTVSVNFSLQ
jgi:TonB family protein